MGCWNGTCGLSQLPIGAGDDVVLFVLEQKHEGFGGGINGFCYATDLYAPVMMPILGKYNDYGSVEDMQPGSEHLLEFFNRELDKRIFVLKEHIDDDEEDINEHELFANLEALIDDIERGKVYTKERRYPDGTEYKSFFGLFMIHTAIYKKVMANFKARVPYGKEDTIYRLMYEKNLNKINESREPLEADSLKAMMRDFDMDRIFSYDDAKVNFRLYTDINKLEAMSAIDLASLVTDFRCFGSCMSLMRKLFIPQAGAGSQSSEYGLHMVMFEGIKEVLEKEAADRKEWADEDEEELVNDWMEETVWFYEGK